MAVFKFLIYVLYFIYKNLNTLQNCFTLAICQFFHTYFLNVTLIEIFLSILIKSYISNEDEIGCRNVKELLVVFLGVLKNEGNYFNIFGIRICVSQNNW